jgi:hypothetical protein
LLRRHQRVVVYDAVLCVLQSRPGMPGLDAFQLTDIMMRLTRKEMSIPSYGDDLADFQQFVASGKLACAHLVL